MVSLLLAAVLQSGSLWSRHLLVPGEFPLPTWGGHFDLPQGLRASLCQASSTPCVLWVGSLTTGRHTRLWTVGFSTSCGKPFAWNQRVRITKLGCGPWSLLEVWVIALLGPHRSALVSPPVKQGGPSPSFRAALIARTTNCQSLCGVPVFRVVRVRVRGLGLGGRLSFIAFRL